MPHTESSTLKEIIVRPTIAILAVTCRDVLREGREGGG